MARKVNFLALKIFLILFLIFLFGKTASILSLAKEDPLKKACEYMDFMAYEQAIPYLQQAALEYPNIKNIKTKNGIIKNQPFSNVVHLHPLGFLT